MTAYSKSSVHGRPARLGSETFTANGTYNANNFNNAKGKPLDGFSQVTVNTPYEAILDGSVDTIDTSVTTLRASAFANMTSLTKLVLRNASSLLSTIQNALPTTLSQGTELNIYVPSSSLDDYTALYGSVYTVNDISLYGRYWFTPTTSETTLTSGMYVSGITAYLTSTDPYDGLSIPSTITALGSGSLTPITSPTSTLGIYDLKFEGNIAAFSSTELTDIDSNFSDSACQIKKFRYNGSTALYRASANNAWFFYGCGSIEEIYCPNITTAPCWLASSTLKYISCPKATSFQTDYQSGSNRASFMGCAALEVFNFPLVTAISAYAFQNCTALKTAKLPAWAGSSSSFAEFLGCTALVLANIPVATSLNRTFSGCTHLASVNCPSLISIIDDSFANTALTSFSSDSVTSIGNAAHNGCFTDCASLASVSMTACTSIGVYAFQRCSSLATAYLPACTSIGNYAFLGCTAISKLKLLSPNKITYFGTGLLVNAPSTLKIYFPYSFIPDYCVATNISSYMNLFVGVLTYASGSLDTTLAISGTTYNVTWYSDEDLTTVFAGTPVVGTKYYAKLSA